MKTITGRTLLILISLGLFALYFFGVIDEPEFKSKLQAKIGKCVQVAARYSYGDKIDCIAKLESGQFVHFTSFYMLESGDVVFFAEYERPVTGLISYGLLSH